MDEYLINGCMRCKYGGTPQCKVRDWEDELVLLRDIVLESGLTEEIKWGVPVYTLNGKNVVTINALKASANIGFFKGALLTDPRQMLQQQGSIQSSRIIKFTSSHDIEAVRNTLQDYIKEAIDIEKSGRKVEVDRSPEPVPEELSQAFAADSSLEKAFLRLTPGRQRGYILHFSQPKQAKTRIARIEKHKDDIMKGVGLHDGYRS